MNNKYDNYFHYKYLTFREYHQDVSTPHIVLMQKNDNSHRRLGLEFYHWCTIYGNFTIRPSHKQGTWNHPCGKHSRYSQDRCPSYQAAPQLNFLKVREDVNNSDKDSTSISYSAF